MLMYYKAAFLRRTFRRRSREKHRIANPFLFFINRGSFSNREKRLFTGFYRRERDRERETETGIWVRP